jgi:HPt (histidine-containing phosphotransfer) domain-containing protein
MDEYLAKPYSVEQLYSVLAQWLPVERRRAVGGVTMRPVAAENIGGEGSCDGKSAIDHSAFDKIRALSPASGDELVVQVISAFLKAAERELGRLEQGAQDGDLALQAKAAHALKSSSFNVGANRFGECCKVLEEAARDGVIVELPANLERLRSEWDRVCGELKGVVEALGK